MNRTRGLRATRKVFTQRRKERKGAKADQRFGRPKELLLTPPLRLCMNLFYGHPQSDAVRHAESMLVTY